MVSLVTFSLPPKASEGQLKRDGMTAEIISDRLVVPSTPSKTTSHAIDVPLFSGSSSSALLIQGPLLLPDPVNHFHHYRQCNLSVYGCMYVGQVRSKCLSSNQRMISPTLGLNYHYD